MKERRVRVVGRPAYGRTQSPPLHRRSRAIMRFGLLPRRFIILVIGLLALAFVLEISFNIKKIEVKPSSRSAAIQSELQKLIDAQWQQHNLLTVNTSALETGLTQAEPMIKTVDVQRQWPHGLVATVTLNQPSLGWVTGDQTYLLDRDGSAIGPFPPGTALPVITDDSNLPVQLGQQVTSSRFINFTITLAQALASLQLDPTHYEVKDTTLDLYVTTSRGYQIILDTSRSVQEEVSSLQTLLTFLRGKPPTQYIDLRIDGRAYYQ